MLLLLPKPENRMSRYYPNQPFFSPQRRRKGLLLVLALAALLPAGAQTIQKLSVKVDTREVAKGYSTNLKGELFYTADGNLVTHITYPEQYILVANSKGEVRLYNPEKNSVRLFQNALFSTSSTQ